MKKEKGHLKKRKWSIVFVYKQIYFQVWRCGGSLAALQNTEAVVPGSNTASLTEENSEDKQSHCVMTVYEYTVKSRGREGDLPLRQKNPNIL